MGMKIMTGGFLTTVQDLGRIGYQETGMAVSGVMDQHSAKIANILVGNDCGEAVLEVTMMGPSIQFTEDNVIAVTGADLGFVINKQPAAMYRALSVHAGDILEFKALKTGLRAYIAFAGGLDIPVVMGSRSTNLKSKVGGFQGRKLEAGDEIGFRAPVRVMDHMERRVAETEIMPTKEIEVRVIMGPQDDCFTEKGKETFLNSEYAFTSELDRMGCRLEGEVIEHVDGGDIISDGITFGAVQVPSHGKPIIMMADHQTTGGYTKIACVITVDLPKVAQAKPGVKLRFKAVSIEEAQELLHEENVRLASLRDSIGKEKNEETIRYKDAGALGSAAPEVQAAAKAALTAAFRENALSPAGDYIYWVPAGTFRIRVGEEEFTVELEKETFGLR